MENFITLNKSTIDKEHICCAISDKKCKDSYELKKDWLKREFDNGYVFRRIDARAKVFMEYGPAEKGWCPVNAPNYLLINCFWVSGQYKGQGYGKELLKLATEDAIAQGKDGLVTVVGTSKFVRKINQKARIPSFNESVKSGQCEDKNGLVVYYSNRCPFSEYHVTTSLQETASKRNLSLNVIKIDSMEKAQSAPTPATIFSLFYNGKFVTTDLSVCMDSRFDKVVKR